VKPTSGLTLVELMGTATVAEIRARTGAHFNVELGSS